VDKTLLETISWRFEDEDFAIPVGYDAILRKEYGDYMQLPPEEDRVGHHYYKAYRKDS
jgi:lipopolysaccharide cholinephosphotransferase